MKRLAIGIAVGVGSGVLAAERDAGKGSLPLREVILYSSGVGYFERAGEVDGDASVELRFRTEDVNDLLKSMVVQDHGGGTVGTIAYDSRDPISRTLHSFALDLTANPSMAQLLNQMRGERVMVTWPNETRGTILGAEQREAGQDEENPRHEWFLNLFSDGGLQSIPLTQVKEIKLENERLQGELTEALGVLARGHDTEKKTVTLSFNGEGKRSVNVAYIAEAPVWKTSYRLVLNSDEKKAFLQGWAIVENTGDDDWENVQLSLISGRPISFKMDLYQPLYAQRPTVQPELYLSLRPQVYQDGGRREALQERDVALGQDFRPSSTTMAAGLAAAPPPTVAGVAGQRFTSGKAVSEMSVESLGRLTGTDSVAAGGISGELFQYALNMPVTIQRQKSAMLPIVTADVEGAKLSIYNQNVQAKHPLNGFRLKNTSKLHLMQGPITVFDGGSYSGDARIEDLAPGQERLISYAIDLKTEIETRAKTEPESIEKVWIRNGTFFASKQLAEEKSYIVRNKDQKQKTVLVEHPVRADWELEAPKASERARDVYRFEVPIEPGRSETIAVREVRTYREEAFVADFAPHVYGLYIRSSKVSERIKEVLRKVLAFRQEIQQVQAERQLREDRLKEIGTEQTRIRDNMARLAQNSELFQRYVKKFDEQETEFERLRGEAGKLKDREAARQREFAEYLSGLSLD